MLGSKLPLSPGVKGGMTGAFDQTKPRTFDPNWQHMNSLMYGTTWMFRWKLVNRLGSMGELTPIYPIYK